MAFSWVKVRPQAAIESAFEKADDGNFLRALAETLLQILMEADVEGEIGAARQERYGEHSAQRLSPRSMRSSAALRTTRASSPATNRSYMTFRTQ